MQSCLEYLLRPNVAEGWLSRVMLVNLARKEHPGRNNDTRDRLKDRRLPSYGEQGNGLSWREDGSKGWVQVLIVHVLREGVRARSKVDLMHLLENPWPIPVTKQHGCKWHKQPEVTLATSSFLLPPFCRNKNVRSRTEQPRSKETNNERTREGPDKYEERKKGETNEKLAKQNYSKAFSIPVSLPKINSKCRSFFMVPAGHAGPR